MKYWIPVYTGMTKWRYWIPVYTGMTEKGRINR